MTVLSQVQVAHAAGVAVKAPARTSENESKARRLLLMFSSFTRLAVNCRHANTGERGEGVYLDFDEDPPPVQDGHQTQPERDVRQSPGERGDVVRQPGAERVAVEPG